MDIRITPAARAVPIITSLPFQLSILALGLFFLTACGATVLVTNTPFALLGLKVSFFDLFVAFLVFIILLILAQ